MNAKYRRLRFDGHGINADDGERVCKVTCMEPYIYDTGRPQRNAEFDELSNILAAAPELLEALRNLLAYANKYSDTMAAKLGRGAEELGELADSSSVAGMARAAIAKATGGDHA